MYDVTQIMHIDPNTEQGKAIIAEIYLNAVINEPEEQLEEYTTDYKALREYLQALAIIKNLAEQGKCTYECDDALVPIYGHTIKVEWTEDENGFVDIPLNEMKKLCELSDSLILSHAHTPFWQFSRDIYVPDNGNVNYNIP